MTPDKRIALNFIVLSSSEVETGLAALPTDLRRLARFPN
jgi:hypothetical protein